MAIRAIQIDFLLAGVRDLSGEPLAAGTVEAYDAGTLVAKSIYTTPTKSGGAATATLDGQGRIQRYGDGAYRFIIKDSDGAQVYDWDNIDLYSVTTVQDFYGGTSGGSANTQTVTIANFPSAYANGQTIIFRTGFAVTGAATLNVNGLGAIAIIQDISGNALVSGDLPANSVVQVTYFGGNFILKGTANYAYANRFIGTQFIASSSILSSNSMQSSGGIFSIGTTDTNSTQFTNNSLARWLLDSSGNLLQNATNGGEVVFQKATSGVVNTVAATVTAAGANLAAATQLTAVINNVSTIALGTGVRLPNLSVGGSCVVNRDGVNILTVYAPDAGQDITKGGSSYGIGGMSLPGSATFHKVSATRWIVVESA